MIQADLEEVDRLVALAKECGVTPLALPSAALSQIRYNALVKAAKILKVEPDDMKQAYPDDLPDEPPSLKDGEQS